MTLGQITPMAGYRHKERLSAVFMRQTGATPGRAPTPKNNAAATVKKMHCGRYNTARSKSKTMTKAGLP